MPPTASTLMNRLIVRAKFRHMQVLVKLAELGSMRRAALAVHMTQPAISQLVSELEKLMEAELFFRHARGVEPTPVAKELLPVAHRILGALEDGAETMANQLQELGGIVRISASPAALGGMIQGRLDAFAQRYPDIQVHITQTNDGDPLGGITEGSADIVGTREPAIVPQGWTFEQCLDDRLIAVCGREHPLAGRDGIDESELGAAKWLMNRVGSVARDHFEAMAARHNWPASARCPVVMHIPALTHEMLVTGRYLAILPQSVALPWLDSGDIRVLRTELDAPLAPLGFLWADARAGTATTAFARHLLAPAREG